eukprot:gene8183-1440_t
MPSLKTFGLHWHLSADDFPIPACMGACFLATWFAVVIASIVVEQENCSADSHDPAFNYYQNTIASLIGLNLLAHGMLMISEVWGLCSEAKQGGWYPETMIKVIVYGSWGGLGAALLATLLLYNVLPKHDNIKGWVKRVNCYLWLTCSMSRRIRARRRSEMLASGDNLNGVEKLAHTLHAQFGQEDLTLSDYVLGLMLLGHWQRLQRADDRAARGGGGDDHVGIPMTEATEEGDYMPLEGSVVPSSQGSVVPSYTRSIDPTHDQLDSMYTSLKLDFKRRMSREAILDMTGISDSDLLLINDENGFEGALPFYLAADHKAKELIVSIRGTWTIEDTITDLMWEPVELEEMTTSAQGGKSGESKCMQPPQGIGDVAERIIPALQQALGLDSSTSLVKPADSSNAHQTSLPRRIMDGKSCRGYSLVITGHSLGAGGMPRLNFANITRARDDFFQLLALCKPNKVFVFLGWLVNKHWKREDLFVKHVEDRKVKLRLQLYQNSIKRHSAQAGAAYQARLVPPGRIIYIQDHKVPMYRSKLACFPTCGTLSPTPSHEDEKAVQFVRQYVAHWVGFEAVCDLGLLVSSNMFWDHTPDKQLGIIQDMLRGQ